MRRRASTRAVSWWKNTCSMMLVLGALPLTACIYIAPSPGPSPPQTIIVRPGPAVVCSNGLPATYSNGAYHC